MFPVYLVDSFTFASFDANDILWISFMKQLFYLDPFAVTIMEYT
jgi:hypothetical protein